MKQPQWLIEKRIAPLRGRKRPPFSPEWRQHLSDSHRGQHSSPATQFKKGHVPVAPFKKGMITWNKGLEGYNGGDKSHFWKGGITNDPGYVSFRSKRRRIRKMNAGGSHTLLQWKELKRMHYGYCLMCGLSEPEIRLTEDHVTPLIRGGSDNIENIQPLCQSCNSTKGTKVLSFMSNEQVSNGE